MPRQLSGEEMRDAFLEVCSFYVDFWKKQKACSEEEKLLGLLHSILCVLDGVSSLPAFILIPAPHESDRNYHEEMGKNWWPEAPEAALEAEDLHGGNMLHDLLYKFRKG